MDRLIIEKYIRDNKRISIPEIQFKFSLTYKETRMLFQELENKKVIKPEDDIYYAVLSQERVASSSDGDHDSQEDDDKVRLERRAREDARRREEIRKRREELRRRMAESHFFDEDDEEDEEDEEDEDDEACYDKEQSEEWVFDDDKDDDDDEDEKTIDEIRREVLKKISATEEPSEDTEDEEETDDDDTALREPKEITVEDIEKRRALAKMATSFGCTGQFIREGREYFCKLGITYPDDTEMQFKLSYPNKITLSDCGGTYTFMSKYFNMSDDNVLKRIKNVMDDYGLGLRIENNKSELYIQIRDENSAFMSFLWLFSAIERITSIQSEGLLSVVSDEFDSFCKSELVRIAIEEKASFLEAKECARSLYIQSLEEDDALKKNAYKNIVETLEGITEEGYESFKREILGEEEE